MAGCYVCSNCGKCTIPDVPTSAIELVCTDCGRAANPGASQSSCEFCGSTHLEFVQTKSLDFPSRRVH